MVCASVCVRRMVVFAVFLENVAVGLQLSQSKHALKIAPPPKHASQISMVLNGLMTQELSSVCGEKFLRRVFGVPFNKRVLAEEEQTVATLLEKSLWRSPNNER